MMSPLDNVTLQRPLRVWFVLFLILNGIDLVSTFLILHYQLVSETLLGTFLLHHVGITFVMVIKVALIVLAIYSVDRVAKRSSAAVELASNVLIVLSGCVLLLVTINLAQCALTYF